MSENVKAVNLTRMLLYCLSNKCSICRCVILKMADGPEWCAPSPSQTIKNLVAGSIKGKGHAYHPYSHFNTDTLYNVVHDSNILKPRQSCFNQPTTICFCFSFSSVASLFFSKSFSLTLFQRLLRFGNASILQTFSTNSRLGFSISLGTSTNAFEKINEWREKGGTGVSCVKNIDSGCLFHSISLRQHRLLQFKLLFARQAAQQPSNIHTRFTMYKR